jgi:hypothetical protein
MLLRILLAGWVLALACRVIIFRDGGEIGAYACTVVFAITTLGLVLLSASRLLARQQGETLPFALILAAVLAFIYRIIVTNGPTAPIASWIFAVCVVALLIVYGRRKWSDRTRATVDLY